jgi:hypothetical protein
MSTTSAISSFLAGLAGGATVAAAVTGGFTLKIKKNKLVQQRRARVYIDMLSWIQARQLTVQAKAHKRVREPEPARKVPEPEPARKVPEPEPARKVPEPEPARKSPSLVLATARLPRK